MSENTQIILSRAPPKVRAKIIDLLVTNDAQPIYNEGQDCYEVEIKVSCASEQIMEQIVRSLTKTVPDPKAELSMFSPIRIQVPSEDYSFSRVLDPLQIYDSDINTVTHKPTSLNIDMAKTKLEQGIDLAFQQLRRSIHANLRPKPSKGKGSKSRQKTSLSPLPSKPHKKSINNPQQNSGSPSFVHSQDFRKFLESRMSSFNPKHQTKLQSTEAHTSLFSQIQSPRTATKTNTKSNHSKFGKINIKKTGFAANY